MMSQTSLKSKRTSLLKSMGMAGFLTAIGLFLSSSVMAQPYLDNGGYADLWEVQSYRDDHANHLAFITQKICIQFVSTLGTHRKYKWWSLSHAGWKGVATQEGDQAMMNGFWKERDWHDAWHLEIDTEDSDDRKMEASGHWWTWRNSDFLTFYTNVKLVRSGVDECELVSPNDPENQKSLEGIPFEFR